MNAREEAKMISGTGRIFGLSVILITLVLAAGGPEQIGQAQDQPECTITVQAGESIQAGIDQAADGDVICLDAGTWQENIRITKSITVQGMGAEQTVLQDSQAGYPVIWIFPPEEAVQTPSVKLDGLTITGGDRWCSDWARGVCNVGVLIQGTAQAVISDSILSGNGFHGIVLTDVAQADLESVAITGNGGDGVQLWDSAGVKIGRSTISENTDDSLQLWDSAHAEISDSLFSKNEDDGLWIGKSASAEISGSTITENGNAGILIGQSARATIIRNTIAKNQGYGVALFQWACYGNPLIRTAFTGRVSGRANLIPPPELPDGNREGSVCPHELGFLRTDEGGEYPSPSD
jgi:parallel beta-helix repeat protein